MADLAQRGYLDDGGYARQWIESRSARGYGVSRLRAELRARGVPAPLIDVALAGLAAADEIERARAVARRRLSVLARSRPERAAVRLRDHLLRRGYEAAVVARVVRECVGAPLEE